MVIMNNKDLFLELSFLYAIFNALSNTNNILLTCTIIREDRDDISNQWHMNQR